MSIGWRERPERWKDRPWTWPILRGVPVPVQSKPVLGRLDVWTTAVKHTMAALDVGDAFLVNGYPQQSGKAKDGRRQSLRATSLQPSREVRQYAREFGYGIKCRTVGRGVVMVWRTA
jgi:hypothetical protein